MDVPEDKEGKSVALCFVSNWKVHSFLPHVGAMKSTSDILGGAIC